MISVDKNEARLIREKFPDIRIVRTVRQKSKRGRYFCEESKPAIRFINEIRGNK